MALHPQKDIRGRVLVTGANGFIGARLCHTLRERGVEVVAGVRRGANLDYLGEDRPPLQFGDVTKPETFEDLLDNIDIVIHNAGLVKATRSEHLFAVNAQGAEALMQAALRRGQATRFIYISSQAAAGPSTGAPRRETDEPAPITDYGRSKLAGEQSLLRYRDRINLQILRPSGVYGPGDRETFTFFQAVARGIRPHIGDITRPVSVIYVDDLTAGIAQALGHDLPSGEIYSLAEPDERSFAELLVLICQTLDRRTLAIPIPGPVFRALGALSQSARLFGAAPMLTWEKAGEVLAGWRVSIERASKHFDFAPQIPFPEGARRAIEWYREQGWL
ncbi:MAG TPA: SDR family NAD(P)-dependent oxidoreductase [candidate division Zixibacteria bacterium]|nr:SDR family NAD(P)-dependent oxidoreductase [candidate division Zixibacteria bacterium]